MEHHSHFVFGTHPEHGVVATATAHILTRLSDWYLTREQFEQVPGTPGLYRLTGPEQDGPRRTRQAVHDLRAQGFAVYADYSLDPVSEPSAGAARQRPADPARPGLRRPLTPTAHHWGPTAGARPGTRRRGDSCAAGGEKPVTSGIR